MRVTVSHNKDPQEIIRNVDRGFDDMFRGLPLGPVAFTEERRSWNGRRLDFSFVARAGFMAFPMRGWVLVEDHQVTVEVDLPPVLEGLLPRKKLETAMKGRVKGMLNPPQSS
jgi:hypothetical protein